MSFQNNSLTTATEIAPPQDVREVLREFAKSARNARKAEISYPRRHELMAALTDARASIDRINASD